MKRRLAILALTALLGSCNPADHRTHLYLQRFFGECSAEYGGVTDVSKAEGECGIMTAIVDRFNAENPDIHIDVNVVAWPGYPQLTAQVAARDPPDLVTMHEGVISDYASKGLVEPVDGYLRSAGITPGDFTEAARQGVTMYGHVYGLPIDTHGGLFHVNTALFAKAGLMRGGRPILPTSADELIAQARQFEAAHRPALSDPEQRRRSGLRRAQPLHLHDGARCDAVSRPQAHPAEHARSGSTSPASSAASMPRSSAPRTWIRRRRSPPSSAAGAASIRPGRG